MDRIKDDEESRVKCVENFEARAEKIWQEVMAPDSKLAGYDLFAFAVCYLGQFALAIGDETFTAAVRPMTIRAYEMHLSGLWDHGVALEEEKEDGLQPE